MHDKYGKTLSIGDHLIPDEGQELVVYAIGETEEMGEVALGYQVGDILASSPLTQENLSAQWQVKN